MKSILIIDDCPEYRSLIGAILLEAEYDVWEVASPDEAFAVLRNENMDMIICDLHMPFTSDERFQEFEVSYKVGINTIKELSGVFPFKPIIAVSAAPPSELRAMTCDLGTVPALNKPFQAEELLLVVARSFADPMGQVVH